MFGVFGTLAYVFPLVLFVGTAFHMSNRGNPAAALKLAAGILAFTLVDSLIQLLAADKAAAGMIGYYAYGAARHISGGWLGGVITGALYPALGMAGQLIVTLILLIICAVVITERSFVGQVQKSGRKVADRAREDAERRREHAQMVREERERERALRMDHKVTGVAMEDIQLEPRPESADVHEVGRFGRKKKGAQTQEQPLQAQEPEENASTAEADVSRAAQKQDTREEDSASDFPERKGCLYDHRYPYEGGAGGSTGSCSLWRSHRGDAGTGGTGYPGPGWIRQPEGCRQCCDAGRWRRN